MRVLIAFSKAEDSTVIQKVTEAVKAARPGDDVVPSGEEWKRVKTTTNNLLAAYRQKLFAAGGTFKPRNDFEAWPMFVATGRQPNDKPRFDALIVPADISQAILVNGVAAVEYGKTTLEIIAAFVNAGKEFSVVCHTGGVVVETLEGHLGDFLVYGSGSYDAYGCLLMPNMRLPEGETEGEAACETEGEQYADYAMTVED